MIVTIKLPYEYQITVLEFKSKVLFTLNILKKNDLNSKEKSINLLQFSKLIISPDFSKYKRI